MSLAQHWTMEYQKKSDAFLLLIGKFNRLSVNELMSPLSDLFSFTSGDWAILDLGVLICDFGVGVCLFEGVCRRIGEGV